MKELSKIEDIEDGNEDSDRCYLRRTLKIEFTPTGKQKALLDSMLAASRYIYNQLIEHLHYKRQEYRRVKELDPQCQPHKIDDYVNVLNKGWAQDLTRTFVFSARLYGSRSKKNKKLIDGMTQAVKDVS